mgnify:FL=1
MKKILLLNFGIFIISVSAQQTINVAKESQDNIKLGDILSVDIKINNLENAEKHYEVREAIPQGVTLIDPDKPNEIEKHNALEVMLYKWDIIIPKNQVFNLNYKIKPNQVGEYTISPTKVIDSETKDMFLSESKHVIVSCIPNNICDENENYLNCPQDCGASIADGICNYKADGICDPDCEKEPDCKNIASNNSSYTIIILVVLLLIVFFLSH